MNVWFGELLQSLHRASWAWIGLWLGLAALSVAILVLLRTQWGNSQPLKKCIVLSLLAHLLLGIYATTIEIVGSGLGPARGEGIHATFWDEGPVTWAEGNPLGNESSPYEETNDPASAVAKAATAEAAEQPKPEQRVLNAEPLLLKPSQNEALVLPQVAAKPAAAEPARTEQPAEAPNVMTPEELAKLLAVVGPADPISAATIQPHGTLPEQAATSSPVKLLQASSAASASELQATTAQIAPSTTPNNIVPAAIAAAATGSVGINAVLPDLYKDRIAENRGELLRSRGGSPESEEAVQRALRWLAAAQSKPGHWDADRFGAGQERLVLGHDRRGAGAKADTAMTGLALLCFLGNGHTHLDNGPYADTIRRGLESLLQAQRRDGSLAGDAELFAAMYSHGIATLALSEALVLSGDKRLEAGVRAAIDYTIRAQHPASGSWRYQPLDSGDMSQLGWQLMALKSAELSGIPTPAATRDGMIRFIKSASSGTHGGIAAYRPNDAPSRTMTAEALVCRQFLGMSRDNPAAGEAATYLLGELPTSDRINLYYWYYGTLGMYQQGGEPWQQWNRAMQTTLLPRQLTTGNNAGSWDPDCVWGGYGGRVYSTAMATLCLEVYYRYLPLYQHEQRLAEQIRMPSEVRR
jgi:hypothetical protein